MRRLCLSLLLGSTLLAQPKPAPVRLTPLRVSPACTLAQDIGISRIELTFARPAVKGRAIWGALVPYGEVWRAGANAATTLTLSHPALVAGKPVAAGTYGFFVIPGLKAWTLVLSRQAKLWGAYDYKAAEDVLRWEATPQAIPFQEVLDYRILPQDTGRATVELAWEKLKVAFPVSFDTRAIYWAHLEAALARAPQDDWVPWYQAAKYCQDEGLEPAKALAWIEQSLAAGESFWNHETAARILRDARRIPESLQHLDRAIALSRGKAPREYTENLEKERQTWAAPPSKP